jgi:hypothetical protein
MVFKTKEQKALYTRIKKGVLKSESCGAPLKDFLDDVEILEGLLLLVQIVEDMED